MADMELHNRGSFRLRSRRRAESPPLARLHCKENYMKTTILCAALALSFTACDTRVNVPPSENNTTVVNPPGDKKETTIVNPPKSETSTSTTTTNTPAGSSTTTTETKK